MTLLAALPLSARQLTADAGIFLLTASALLMFFELNRPGLVIPGALGLLGVLLAIASWQQWHLRLPAIFLLLAGTALPLWQLRHPTSGSWALLAAVLFTLGFSYLVRGPGTAHVHWPVAVACGLVLGMGASGLARIAQRARQNKGLN